MKFIAVILAAFVAATDAAPSVKARTLGGTSVRDVLSQRNIMEKAVRVNRQGERMLDQNQKFELSSAYSLQFDTCVSLTTEPSEDGGVIFDDALIKYTSDGYIVPQKSYVLFSVCKTAYCDYYAKDDNLYMIDLATYMGAISEFYQEREESYCSACVDSYNYCKYVQYQKANNKYYNEYQGASAYYATEDAAAAAEANGGGRELNRYNFELIDCDVCNTLNCFYSETEATYTEGQTAKPDSEAIASWVETISQCQDTGLYFFTDYPMYAGFMCNEDGSGVDIATFLDESCTIYNSKVAYKSIASADDQLIMYEAKDMIMYPFQHTINCNGEYAYLSMDEYRQQAQSNAYSNNNNNNYGEASDYCQSLFEGGDYGAAVSLKDCNADGEEDERQEGDEEVTEYVDYNFNWFQYSLSYEDSLDNGATCMVVRNMQGEYDRVYRWSGSGQLYNYGTGPSKYSFYNSESLKNLLSSYDKMGATLIAAIVVGVVVALTAFGCILYSCCSKKSVVNGAYMDQKVVEEQQKEQQKELDLKRQLEHQKKLDSKRERLVDASTGHLM